jgi:hypothetical protein
MGHVLLFTLTAMANPTLVAAVTVMLLLPDPKRLMIGYLCGAMLTSITLGILIVFEAQHLGITGSAKHTLNPIEDFVIGGLLLTVAFVLHGGRDRSVRERRAERKRSKQEGKPEKVPRWEQWLRRGNPRITFALGVVLTLPGASYLAALSSLAKLHYSDAATVVIVVLINIVMMALLEIPLAGYLIAPEETPRRVERAKTAVRQHGRRGVITLAAVLGTLLIVRGLITSFT